MTLVLCCNYVSFAWQFQAQHCVYCKLAEEGYKTNSGENFGELKLKIEIFIPLKPGSKDQPNVIGRFIGRDGQNVSRENSFLKFVYILKPFSVVLLPFTFMQERISKLFTIISCVPWFFFSPKKKWVKSLLSIYYCCDLYLVQLWYLVQFNLVPPNHFG